MIANPMDRWIASHSTSVILGHPRELERTAVMAEIHENTTLMPNQQSVGPLYAKAYLTTLSRWCIGASLLGFICWYFFFQRYQDNFGFIRNSRASGLKKSGHSCLFWSYKASERKSAHVHEFYIMPSASVAMGMFARLIARDESNLKFVRPRTRCGVRPADRIR